MSAARSPAEVLGRRGLAATPAVKYVRPPAPLHFPEQASLPEGPLHLFLRTLLQRILKLALGEAHTVGSDHFVYWNARDPKRSLAPDVFVKRDVPEAWYRSWKTWERGAPELAVEVVSSDVVEEPRWEEKLARYHELGVLELVRFDPDAAPGQRLRVWDRVDEDLVERAVEGDEAPCLTLGLTWVVVPEGRAPAALRLADPSGELLPTPEERERAKADAERANADAERAKADAERARAERLEAQLRALGVEPGS